MKYNVVGIEIEVLLPPGWIGKAFERPFEDFEVRHDPCFLAATS
jgi:hypothetical protein